MDDTNFFSTETITLPFNLFAIVFRKQAGKYSAKWDRGLRDF